MSSNRVAALISAVILFALPSLGAELVVWHAYRAEEKAALEAVVAAYNASHAKSGITVTTLAVPFDAMADKISAAIPRGKGADVFIYAQDRLGGWIESGNIIEPLDFYLEKGLKESYLPLTWEAMSYRGTVYGLPLNYKALVLIYNKKLVANPPKTSGELVVTAKKLTDKASGRFGLAYSYGDFYYHAALMNGFGGRAFDPGPTPMLNAPENAKSLELLLKWIYADQILPAEPSTGLVTALFNEGKTAMVFSGPWFLGEIAKSVDFGLATLPTLDEAGGKPMRPWATVEGAFIAAPCKNKDAAYEFIKYLTGAEAAKVMAIRGRQSPASKAAYAVPAIANDPILKVFRQQIEVAVPMPNVPEMSMMWTPATIAMGSTIKRSVSPKEALETAQKALARDVANLRKK
jgi:arabinogalactan oligomer/maltooligosaccharide transport system substrate-binding protein